MRACAFLELTASQNCHLRDASRPAFEPVSPTEFSPTPSVLFRARLKPRLSLSFPTFSTQKHPTPAMRSLTKPLATRSRLTCLAFWTTAAFAQTASPPDNSGPAGGDEVVTLSPFEVVSDTKGYYSANTMSGTRFNTKLQDLGASITVMTKEQMSDFAMTDINDVFLYTAGTEGTGTYSDFAMNRNGELTDNVSLNPTQANRVRGIAAANVSYGNFETMGRVPLDPLVLEGVEISRGPNANVFGLGNPSGTVNQVPVGANTTRHRTLIEGRLDDWDGHRASLDVNRYLIKDKLAIRFSALDQREGFVRKPSGLDTVRYNGMIKYQPFKNTTINASYLYYKSDGNRPNFTPPRDYVSYWAENGKPTWDPITQTVHSNGQSFGPFINDNFLGTPVGFALNRSGGQFQRSNVFVDQSGITYWTAPTNNTGSTPAANTGSGATFNPNGTPRPTGFIRLLGSSPGPNGATGKFLDQPLFNSVRSVISKDLYDYEEINLASPNYIWDEVDTYYATIDQVFVDRPEQLLVGQLGFFREDADRYRRIPIGDAGTGGQNGQLWVDVNEKNIDGSPNPNVGRPYIGVNEPIYSYTPEKWDTYRAQLAYRYDFTQSSGWTKWLGSHQISPYYEYKYRVARKYSYREAIASDHPWLVVGQPGVVSNFARANQANITGGPQAGPNIARPFYRWYVGDADGTNVDFAPGPIVHGTYPLVWGTTGNWRNEPAALQELATTNNTGGANNLKRIIKSTGAVLHSQFLDGKLVATFGLREDKVYAKQGATPQQLLNDNTEHDFTQLHSWEKDHRFSSGKTKTAQFVARPFRDLGFIERWSQSSGGKGFLADLLGNAALTYNKSDNFIPAAPAVDLFLRTLPNQTGEGEDMGVWFNLFDDKLVVRINRYENRQINARDGDANTIAQRTLRLDLDVTTDRHRLYTRATDWIQLTNTGWSAGQVETAVFQTMQMDEATYTGLAENFRAGTIAATNDILAKGTEIEVNYNPTRFWTISANAEEKRSTNLNVSSTVQDWIDQRMPVWTSIVDQNFDPALTSGTAESGGWPATAANPNHLWWLHRYGTATQSAAENFAVNVEAPWSIIRETEGKSRPQIRRYAARLATNFGLEGITDHSTLKKFSIGGAVRWEDRGAIGYYGVEQYPAVITRLDSNRPIWDEQRFYFDAFIAYKTKLFSDKVAATFRFNVRNLQEGGRLQAVGAFPNGEIHSYRIVDPRQFFLTASFDL
jgi:hypothetical protein